LLEKIRPYGNPDRRKNINMPRLLTWHPRKNRNGQKIRRLAMA
jgi:hypothetical protein